MYSKWISVKHICFKNMQNIFLNMQNISKKILHSCATACPVYTHSHVCMHTPCARTCYHAHRFSQTEGKYDVASSNRNAMVARTLVLAQSQSSSYFRAHYVKISRFPLRPFIHTYLLVIEYWFIFFFVIQYCKCLKSCSEQKPYEKESLITATK